MSDVGVAAMTITDERLEQVNFSKPYVTAKQVIIVRDKE
jgi:ABC-type amino acid transport substrate-binding protein